MKKLLFTLLALLVLGGCTTPRQNYEQKMREWVEIGYNMTCRKINIDGIICIACEHGAQGISLQCNF